MNKFNLRMSKAFVATKAATIAAAILATAFSSLTVAQTPAMQNAIVQAGTGDIDVLFLQRVPVLMPEQGEVLVRVYAAAINARDWKFRSGMYADRAPGTGYGEPKVTPPSSANIHVPGTDAAGIIEQVGPGVTRYQVGDAVFASVKGAFVTSRLNGAYSEFVVVSAENLVRKPADMTFAEAAGLGNATTTGIATVVSMEVKAGERILILGASGGVGSAAVQAAVAGGAYVIGTASPRHNDFLNSLGINEIHNYREGTWQDDIRDIDYVIDTVSKDNLMLSLSTVNPGATMVGFNVSLTDEECIEYNVTCFGRGIGGVEALAAMSELAHAGLVRVNVDETFPLAEAGAAQEENRNGGTQGKIILIVDEAKANSK